jgi:hypothetical protein
MGIFSDFIKTAYKQIFGKTEEELPRDGKLVLSKKAFSKMVEWGLDEETLKLTYQVGEKTSKGNGVYQITRKYQFYSVGLWYVEEYRPLKGTKQVEKVCFVITCWKGSVKV